MRVEQVSYLCAHDVTLRGDAFGSPDDRPVLLLHGGGQTRHSWSGTAAELAASGWYAVSLDLRGHGESDWSPHGAYPFQHFADDTATIAARFDQPPVLIGASLGGLAALMAETDTESRLAAAIVLVDVTPTLERRGVERILNFMNARPDGFESLEEAGDFVSSFRQHRPRPKDLSGLSKNLRQGEDGRYRWHWDPAFLSGAEAIGGQITFESNPLLDAARKLTAPTLLVRGRASDVVSEEGAAEFRAAVPHAEYVDVTDAGHMVAGDRNDAFTSAVIDFLRDTF